ncbi:hypothetical protein BWI15_00905 [Kribbella sp. ALI-6-A]|uniref:hypothetical protein n=1 Tax=Kribbella sp. ALI-6-A TaxID=1933817 RepID=UPI00097BB95F|nr:hypothetical protein [Kribbella sp. ALI-6-A]ONI78465.1 hypothetical protein BWI15_00905 [Kribbella sp. ALI-6-A]
MPDVVPAVLAEGPRAVRRYRALVGAGAVLSTLAVVAAAVTVTPRLQSEPPVAPVTTLRPIPAVLGYDEFLGYAAQTLTAVLPEGFGAVEVGPVADRGNMSVRAGGATFPITFELSEPMADFPGPGTTCAPQVPLDKGTVRVEPDNDECQVKPLASGGLAMVRRPSERQQQTVHNGVVVVEPAGGRNAVLTLDHHGLGLRLAIFADLSGTSAPIDGDQLLAIAADPRLTDLLDVWSTHLSSTYRWIDGPTTPPTPR